MERKARLEAGLYEVWTRLSTGRIRIFTSLQSVFEELRVYRRDDKGKVVKERDHLTGGHQSRAPRLICAT